MSIVIYTSRIPPLDALQRIHLRSANVQDAEHAFLPSSNFSFIEFCLLGLLPCRDHRANGFYIMKIELLGYERTVDVNEMKRENDSLRIIGKKDCDL